MWELNRILLSKMENCINFNCVVEDFDEIDIFIFGHQLFS